MEDEQGTGSKFTSASVNDALSTKSFWRSMLSISPQELKDKDERNAERRNVSAFDQAFEKLAWCYQQMGLKANSCQNKRTLLITL